MTIFTFPCELSIHQRASARSLVSDSEYPASMTSVGQSSLRIGDGIYAESPSLLDVSMLLVPLNFVDPMGSKAYSGMPIDDILNMIFRPNTR